LTLEDGTDRVRLKDNVADRRNANKIAFSKYEWKRSYTKCMTKWQDTIEKDFISKRLYKDLNCIHLAQDKIQGKIL